MSIESSLIIAAFVIVVGTSLFTFMRVEKFIDKYQSKKKQI